MGEYYLVLAAGTPLHVHHFKLEHFLLNLSAHAPGGLRPTVCLCVCVCVLVSVTKGPGDEASLLPH